MPELPEITILAQQMEHELAGRRFSGVEVIQPKSLNLPAVPAVIGSRCSPLGTRAPR